jgi:hypothetical protein
MSPVPPGTRIAPDQLELLKKRLYGGDQQFDAVLVRRLVAEIQGLREELAEARLTFARKAAEALQRRLATVATYNHGGCPQCRDAEAHAFLAKLRKIASPPAAP